MASTSPETVSYSYDAGWRQTSVCSTTFGGCYATNATYTALDQREQLTVGNGLLDRWSYSSPMSRPATLQVGTTGAPTSILSRKLQLRRDR